MGKRTPDRALACAPVNRYLGLLPSLPVALSWLVRTAGDGSM